MWGGVGFGASSPGGILKDEVGVGRDNTAFSSAVDARIQVGERNDSGVERFTVRDSPIKLVTRTLLPGVFWAAGLE
jgi:hypothetical protein